MTDTKTTLYFAVLAEWEREKGPVAIRLKLKHYLHTNGVWVWVRFFKLYKVYSERITLTQSIFVAGYGFWYAMCIPTVLRHCK